MARRNRDQLPEERLVENVIKAVNADAAMIIKAMMPRGRAPFQVKLSRKESEERMMQAAPETIQAWAQQLASISDRKVRRNALADLFEAYGEAQIKRLDADYRIEDVMRIAAGLEPAPPMYPQPFVEQPPMPEGGPAPMDQGGIPGPGPLPEGMPPEQVMPDVQQQPI